MERHAKCVNIGKDGLDIGFGNGIDITDVFDIEGNLNLKFAPIFSRDAGAQPVIQDLPEQGQISSAQINTTMLHFQKTNKKNA